MTKFYLDLHRDGDADEVAELDALGALREIEVPDRIRQRRGRAVRHGEMIDAARARQMTRENMSRCGRVCEFFRRDVEPYREGAGRMPGRLLLLAAFERAVIVDVEIAVNDMNGCTVF